MSRSIDRAAVAVFFALTASSGANAAGARPDSTVTCNIPQPCALYENANGIGLSATSAKSEGLYGSTSFAATSTSNRTYGVEGVDASTNKNEYNAGLYGSSPYGYGMYASSPNGTAVYATSTSGVGLRAASTSGYAVNAASMNGIAVSAISKADYGVYASSTSNIAINAQSSGSYAVQAMTAVDDVGAPFAAIIGVDESSGDDNDGVVGITMNGEFGVEGDSHDSSGGGGVYGSAEYGTGVTGYGGAVGLAGSSDTYPLYLRSGAGTAELYVTSVGDMYAHGSYKTFVNTRNGEATTFTPRSTTSTLEDSGTAELTGGTATVRFDPTFAASIDARAVYQVFLTPGGDTRGLFVARKTPAGFVVRETQGGRGTFSFDYRIVAAAPGHAGERMALVPAGSVHEPRALPTRKTFPFTKKPIANQ